MDDSEIEIYVGDVPLVSRTESAAAESLDLLDLAATRLSGIGAQLTKIFSAMHPSRIATEVGAEAFDLEIGFSIEAGPGSLLKLVISPKVGMSCKATMRWKPLSETGAIEDMARKPGDVSIPERGNFSDNGSDADTSH